MDRTQKELKIRENVGLAKKMTTERYTYGGVRFFVYGEGSEYAEKT